jgi:hypothetical protein
MAMFEPDRDLAAPERSNLSPGRRATIRSYLLFRVAIGCIAVLFPLALIIIDGFFLQGAFGKRGSLSAYYHSGTRDVFVGFLITIGVFLIAYRVSAYHIDNWLSLLAGTAGVLVAMFPTDRPKSSGALSSITPLQEKLGEGAVAAVHYVAAAIFIALLCLMSVIFGIREGKRRSADRGKLPPSFWRLFHWSCAGVIVLASLYILATNRAHWFSDKYSMLIGETLAVWAFSLSWFFKGSELKLLKDSTPPEPVAA